MRSGNDRREVAAGGKGDGGNGEGGPTRVAGDRQHRGRRALAVVACGLACTLPLLAACGRSDDAPAGRAGDPAGASAAPGGTAPASPAASSPAAPSAETRAREIRTAAASWPKIEGRWQQGSVDAAYVAYFDGGEPKYVVERSAAGDAGAQSEYWFEGGALWYFAATRASTYGGEGPGALPPTVPLVAEFRGAEVVRAVAREHYGEKKLDDAAVAAIRRRAAQLAGAAQDEWSAREAK